MANAFVNLFQREHRYRKTHKLQPPKTPLYMLKGIRTKARERLTTTGRRERGERLHRQQIELYEPRTPKKEVPIMARERYNTELNVQAQQKAIHKERMARIKRLREAKRMQMLRANYVPEPQKIQKPQPSGEATTGGYFG